MPNYSYLESEARKIAQAAEDPVVVKLAKIVEQLCDGCDDLEKATKKAHDEAKRAMREAKK